MSWQKAADLAREMAAASRAEADNVWVNDTQMAAFKAYLHAADQEALVAWTRRRKALELEQFAAECDRRRDTEITVIERGPRK